MALARILVISPTPTHPRDAGNRVRIFSLLTGLKNAGHNIFIAFVEMEVGDGAAMSAVWDGYLPIPYHRSRDRWWKIQFDRWSRRLGANHVLPYRIDDWYNPDISRRLAIFREQIKPDVVLVEYVFISRAFECFGPDTLKILDTHDIFGERHKLYLNNGMLPQWFYTTAQEEKKALDRADVVIAIQAEEAGFFSSLTRRRVITVGHLASPAVSADSSILAHRLLFVGSGNPINVEGLRWFIAEIFPLLRRQIPNIELEVIGACAQQISFQVGLLLTGRVDQIAPHYHQAKIVINPVRFGTGLKIKVVEALAHGRPLVTTSAGAAGLEEWAGSAFLTADDPEAFIAAILSLFESDDLRNKLTAGAIKFTRSNNEATLQPLLSLIAQRNSPVDSDSNFSSH